MVNWIKFLFFVTPLSLVSWFFFKGIYIIAWDKPELREPSCVIDIFMFLLVFLPINYIASIMKDD